MAASKSTPIKKKNGTTKKKTGFPPSLIFAFLALGVGVLATQFEDPTSLTASFRRWRADREILRKANEMGGHVYSLDPLVIYLPNFLNNSEVAYIARMGTKLAEPSLVLEGNEETVDRKTRSSKSAILPFADPIVRDIAERSQRFHGYNDISHLESLQVVSYGFSDHFMHHYDYIQDGKVFEANGYNRDTTMLVYLEDNCTGGGTNFPELEVMKGDKVNPFWASVLDFNDTNAPKGATFKPVAGAAIFWRNLDATGEGLPEVVHAGLPVKTGRKSAVNIWTAQKPIKADSWSGLACLDEKGGTYDCAWDDPKARPGIPIEYSGNYWVQEGEAYKFMIQQVDDLYAQVRALEGAEGSTVEKKELEHQIKQAEEVMRDAKTELESMLKSSSKKQVELQNLIRDIGVSMKRQR